MSSIFLHLQKVHDLVHDFPMKLNYSKPKIYTGGVDIHQWSKLSKKEQKDALSKYWYVYYSYRNPKSGKLVRQSNIKGGANQYKDKQSRYHVLKMLKKGLEIVLQDGFSPYNINVSLEEYIQQKFQNKSNSKNKSTTRLESIQDSNETEENTVVLNIEDAFKLGLDTKNKVLNENSYPKFKSRINRFKKWLLESNFEMQKCITTITKKHVIEYLNTVLQNSSPRNRNNTRTDLSSLFQVLEDNDVIQENFIKKINVLKAIPERNKTYKTSQLKEIHDYLDKEDPILSLFVKFIAFNTLRPIEVCRLKIGDLDLVDKKLYVRAKNKPVKVKIIPDILLSELEILHGKKTDLLLFTPNNIGGEWDTNESNRRDYFTKKFKKVKDHFGLGKNYGLYSFRHTYITIMYQNLAKTFTPHEVKSKLMLITGHATMNALEQYLRDIDAVLPDDYSKLLK
ncbi:site-specific integrase [Lacinutrix sp. 5H-3-7-4]|uniref:tyrosine-type recombinase/integrase n=1 Tax=Lacinutrix sp. (strain 5H-3-7-4) TaxID=983544 RepID=UPI00020A33E6|nr:site-specific integrase [Lacinutrix sp. 5H-3-7-4]AEH01400.1 integrase family protein [Lacinutrix sp. 5H-3-7-4]